MDSLVTSSWVASRLDDQSVVILDATLPPVGVTPPIDTHARYVAKHIPGAIFFDIEALSDRTNPLPHMLPQPDVFSREMSALGISDQQNIVIYEQEGVFSAPRAWWTLKTFGAQNVYLLDGGLSAWIEAGLPVHAGEVHRAPAVFHARLDQKAVKDFSHVQQMIATHGQILDARSAGRFAGTMPEPRPGISSGHMPGATSIPYTELVDQGRLKPIEELRRIFAAKELDLNKPITTTCGSGVTAAVLAFGLEAAGATDVSLYDGSWAEYAACPDAVIERGVPVGASPDKR
jgi:thiosulfate/3-mercaptopyruvate sulfurtransferase